MPTWGWIIITLLVLVVLAALEYGFRVVSMAAGEVRRSSMAVKLYLESQVQEMPKPRAVPSVLGLLILALGVVAIVGYFPIYQHVLRSALRLNPQQSHSLAFLLIIFIGLSGVLADITSRFGRRSEAEEPAPASSAIPTRASHAVRLGRDYVERGRDGHSGTFVYMLLMSLLALIALSLLMFQGILYLEFYQSRAAEGSRIPFAFGAAALFIAGIEMLNFYWATRLALDFIAWLFVQVLLLAPPLLVSQAALITERAFLSLPSRVKSKVQEESPQTELSSKSSLSEVGIPKVKEAVLEDDARRIANVFIITKLGDHLCAETPKHTDNGWRARVTNKLSGKVEGELEIDRDTGAVEWLPSMEEERHAIERSAQTIPDG